MSTEYAHRWGRFDGTHHLSIWGPLPPLKAEPQLPAEMHELRKIETLSDDLKNAAIGAGWPYPAIMFLSLSIKDASLVELVALAERLKGSPTAQ